MRPSIVAAVLAAFLIVGPVAAENEGFSFQGHRGARGLAPENTIPGFVKALAVGVDTLELDVGITKDGVAVVTHDRRLNPDLARDRDGEYVRAPVPIVAALTFDELKDYDVGQIRPGSSYSGTHSDQVPVPGTPIPALAEVLDLLRHPDAAHVRINVETKISPLHPDETVDPDRFVAVLLATLEREGFLDRTIIQSFDWRTLQLVQQKAPGVPTAYLTNQRGATPNIRFGEPSPWTAGFDPHLHGGSLPRAVKAAGGAIWSPNHRDLAPAQISEAHELGLKVIPWTVNDPDDMTRLIDAGVDGIITDRPDLLRQVAAEKGLKPPTPVTVPDPRR